MPETVKANAAVEVYSEVAILSENVHIFLISPQQSGCQLQLD